MTAPIDIAELERLIAWFSDPDFAGPMQLLRSWSDMDSRYTEAIDFLKELRQLRAEREAAQNMADLFENTLQSLNLHTAALEHKPAPSLADAHPNSLLGEGRDALAAYRQTQEVRNG